MGPGIGAHGTGRLAGTFTGDGRRVFLREHGETWTVDRLLAYAGDVDRAVPSDAGALVGVRSHTAAFVFASLLGLWKSGRSPILLDPTLAAEPSGLRARSGPMPVLAPAGVAGPPNDVVVPETGSAAIVPRFPAPAEAEVSFFTSGSTGEPKVVRKQAYQMGEQHEVEAPWLGLTGPIPVLCLVPAFHILGYIYGFSIPAAGGGTTVYARGGAPQSWVERIRAESPRLVVGVPSHYRLLSQILASPLPAATYLCSGGPVDPAVAEEFRRRSGSEILQVYGSTETGGIAVRHGLGPWQPFPALSWQSRETDGRLLVRSAWQDQPDEWISTDDVVAVEGGTFRLLGRADSVVKIGARRFSTGEVVQAALAAPFVEQAHAVVYARFGEPAVALFVVPRAGAALAAADVRHVLASRLAPFKIPRTIEVVAELPTRGIGKVDEDALRRLVSSPSSAAPA